MNKAVTLEMISIAEEANEDIFGGNLDRKRGLLVSLGEPSLESKGDQHGCRHSRSLLDPRDLLHKRPF